MNVVHELKAWPVYYRAIKSGAKPFEARRDDRGIEVGHRLHIREWDEGSQLYTGEGLMADVTYKLTGGQFGIAEGWCVLGLANVRRPEKPGEPVPRRGADAPQLRPGPGSRRCPRSRVAARQGVGAWHCHQG